MKSLQDWCDAQDQKISNLHEMLEALWQNEREKVGRRSLATLATGWAGLMLWVHLGAPIISNLDKTVGSKLGWLTGGSADKGILGTMKETIAPDLLRPVKRGDRVGGYTIGSPFQPCIREDKADCRRHPVTGRLQAHRGVDVATPIGTQLYAIGRNKVKVECRTQPDGAGLYAVLTPSDRSDGTQFLAMHLSRCVLGELNTGVIFGTTGNSGLSTGPHLHWEERVGGRPAQPKYYWLHQVLLGDNPKPMFGGGK